MGGIVSGVSDLFGGATNNAGTVAQSANLIQPVSQDQVNNGQATANNAINQQQMLAQLLGGQGSQGMNTQSNLTQALTNQANGVGPNPAQAALNENTGQNIQGQAALAAGQRGAGSNVGLIARQVGQQGAGIQQQAVGQSAVLQAQQQLAAQQQLQQLASAQIGQEAGAVSNFNNSALNNQGQLLGALGGYNSAQVGNTGSQNSANAGIAQTNANNTAKTIGGAINGASAIPALFGAEGGEVDNSKEILAKALSKKQFPDHLRAIAEIYHPKVLKKADGGEIDQPIPDQGQDMFASVKSELPLLASGIAASKGAEVPGDPKVPGKNTLKNDVVPAMLTPKEIVLPLSVTQSKDPGEAAKLFVEHIKGKDSGDFKEALRTHMKNRKSKK